MICAAPAPAKKSKTTRRYNRRWRQKLSIIARQDWRCAYCGRRAVDPCDIAKLTLDHFVPKAHGGTRGENGDNLVVACHVCNDLKGSRVVETIAAARVVISQSRRRIRNRVRTAARSAGIDLPSPLWYRLACWFKRLRAKAQHWLWKIRNR